MVKLKTYSKDKWLKITSEHSGKEPRHTFSVIDSDKSFDNKTVTRGWQTPRGGGSDVLTSTGFLENETGQVVAGVDTIPTDKPNTSED